MSKAGELIGFLSLVVLCATITYGLGYLLLVGEIL